MKIRLDGTNSMLDDGETKSLQDTGITELDYAQSRFTQNGQVKLMASREIEAECDDMIAAANAEPFMHAA